MTHEAILIAAPFRKVQPDLPGLALAEVLEPRWALPVLSLLADSGAERLYRIQRLLGATPRALKPSMEFCRLRRWILPNPGNGHPLRPEWLLAESARPLARAAADLVRALDAQGHTRLLASKWALPVLRRIAAGGYRFRDLKATLAVPDRSLALVLDLLEPAGLVEHSPDPDRPAGYRYTVLPAAHPLLDAVEAMVEAITRDQSGTQESVGLGA